MTINDLIKKIEVKDIDSDLMSRIVFDIERYFDKNFVSELKNVQKTNNIIFDSTKRKILRKQYYYGDFFKNSTKYSIKKLEYTKEDLDIALTDLSDRIDKYDSDKILKSLKKRFIELNEIKENANADWLKEYKKINKGSKYSFLEIKVTQSDFEKHNCKEQYIYDLIKRTYNLLENYRHFAFVVDGELFNSNGECVTWQIISHVSIYAENFIKFKDSYSQFKKDAKIKELNNFLETKNIFNEELAKKFYDCVSTGYKFEDCYISDTQSTKIIIFKKIKYDNRHILCPDCHTIIQSSNSYPELFLQSWECKNPECCSRSKSGRGKRFDAYGVYRSIKLEENEKQNIIDNDFYKNWRRDIFDSKLDWHEMLLKEYSYNKEKFYTVNDNFTKTYGRKQINIEINKIKFDANFSKSYEDLNIVIFLKSVYAELSKIKTTGVNKLTNKITILNESSTVGVAKLQYGQIGTAITSPPYYNAREYSQWTNLICYLIDMMENCGNIYDVMLNDGYYLYNIGDIVSEDNVYVSSHTSKRRIPLGFLSVLIFEIAGFNTAGNIIWDKGEVQSKRNSTNNLYAGFVKCVNCYEHFWVFKKGINKDVINDVEKITPVIKINSKGINIVKHTAPYPIELVDLAKKYVNNDAYVLDPFLGSGTTLRWCKQNDLKGLGFELNKEYYELCKDNIENV